MAIRIITGTPGAGKTFFAMNHIVNNYCYYSKKSASYRLKKDFTIISNIDEMSLKHISLDDALEQSGKNIESFFVEPYQRKITDKYKKIIYILDEASRYFHSKFFNNDVFYYFQYHRHLGHDIYLIVHQFDLLPKQIRALAEYEIRAVNRSLSLLGEFKYNILLGKEIIDRKLIKRNKKIFELYKSQDFSESEKIKNPFRKVFAFLIVFSLISGYFFYKTFLPKFYSKKATVTGGSLPVKGGSLPEGVRSGKFNNIMPSDFYEIQLSFIQYGDQIYLVDPVSNNIIPAVSFPYKLRIAKNISKAQFFAQIPKSDLEMIKQMDQKNEVETITN